MTKNDIITSISDKVREPKTTCENIVDEFIDEIKNCLINGEKITIKGFVGFDVSERKERQGRNPKTGEVVTFPAVKSVKCKVSKSFKEAVNGK